MLLTGNDRVLVNTLLSAKVITVLYTYIWKQMSVSLFVHRQKSEGSWRGFCRVRETMNDVILKKITFDFMWTLLGYFTLLLLIYVVVFVFFPIIILFLFHLSSSALMPCPQKHKKSAQNCQISYRRFVSKSCWCFWRGKGGRFFFTSGINRINITN